MTLKEPLISQVPLFANLPAKEHAYLAATLRQVAYVSGALLFREGDFGEHFYIVLEGQLEIIKAFGTANGTVNTGEGVLQVFYLHEMPKDQSGLPSI